jgi:hypothetical protein
MTYFDRIPILLFELDGEWGLPMFNAGMSRRLRAFILVGAALGGFYGPSVNLFNNECEGVCGI